MENSIKQFRFDISETAVAAEGGNLLFYSELFCDQYYSCCKSICFHSGGCVWRCDVIWKFKKAFKSSVRRLTKPLNDSHQFLLILMHEYLTSLLCFTVNCSTHKKRVKRWFEKFIELCDECRAWES